jgi:hypothetical protein
MLFISSLSSQRTSGCRANQIRSVRKDSSSGESSFSLMIIRETESACQLHIGQFLNSDGKFGHFMPHRQIHGEDLLSFNPILLDSVLLMLWPLGDANRSAIRSGTGGVTRK